MPTQLENDSIIAIKITRNFPILDNKTGKVTGYEIEEANVFYYRDYILHKVPYVYNIHKISDSGIAEIVEAQERRSFFIYKKDNYFGFFTDSSRGIHFTKVGVDSIFSTFWHVQPLMDRILKESNLKLRDSFKIIPISHKLVYEIQSKTDTSQKGKLTLNYSKKFPQVMFKLSNEFDTINQLKLISIQILNESRYAKEYNLHIDEVQQNREIKVLDTFNTAEISSFFKLIKKRENL